MTADISFLVLKDDQGHYRLENNASNEQERIDMTEQEAEAWIDEQAKRLTLSEQLYAKSLTFAVDDARRWVYLRASALAVDYEQDAGRVKATCEVEAIRYGNAASVIPQTPQTAIAQLHFQRVSDTYRAIADSL